MERHCAPKTVPLRRLRYASLRQRVDNIGESLEFLQSRIEIYEIYSIENFAEKLQFRRAKRSRSFGKHHYAVSS